MCMYMTYLPFPLPTFADGCPFEGAVPLFPESSIVINWPESDIGDTASQLCPCQDITLQYGSHVQRPCLGSYTLGGKWGGTSDAVCGLSTDSIIQLCEATLVSASMRVFFYVKGSCYPGCCYWKDCFIMCVRAHKNIMYVCMYNVLHRRCLV